MGQELMKQVESLSRRELEQQDVELLPHREEMSLVNVNGDFHASGILNGSFHSTNSTVGTVDVL
jgi:hypothetical protein